MITFLLAWRLSAAIQRYLQTYARTNIAIAGLRTRRGLECAIPSALVATPTYAWASTVLLDVIDRGGPPWLGFVAMLYVWNALKFAINAILTPWSSSRMSASSSTEYIGRSRMRHRVTGERGSPTRSPT